MWFIVDMKNQRELGNLNISHSVIEKITMLIISDTEGVHSMATPPEKLAGLFIKSAKAKPISISMNMDVAVIDIYINLKAGYRIKDIAEKIQANVKQTVQNMASVTVAKVNIYVQGIKSDEEK